MCRLCGDYGSPLLGLCTCAWRPRPHASKCNNNNVIAVAQNVVKTCVWPKCPPAYKLPNGGGGCPTSLIWIGMGGLDGLDWIGLGWMDWMVELDCIDLIGMLELG